ncbi:hypothetical protein D3C87_1675500 [compost metagenome]
MPGRKYSGFWKSLNTKTACTTITVTMTGLSSGSTTAKNSRMGPAPSMMAASSSSLGIVATNARNSRTQNASPNVASIRIMPGIVLNSPTPWSTQMVGTTAGGTMSAASTMKLMTGFHRLRLRCST